ncbi:hypothetical protein L3Q67_31810 [Saccharothrix sp. AJ9571]|nr:hypothetical protein L3Q67_31810 [Saccharothrix sp. AJ9571]
MSREAELDARERVSFRSKWLAAQNGAMSSRSSGQYLPEISEEVAKHIRGEVSDGEKVLCCLRAAGALLTRAMADDTGLRYLESAAYNLRQAFDGHQRSRIAKNTIRTC